MDDFIDAGRTISRTKRSARVAPTAESDAAPAPRKSKTKSTAVVSESDDAAASDVMALELGNLARQLYGSSAIHIPTKREVYPVGIPIPRALPFEYMIGIDGLPLGVFLMLTADPGVGKSGFMAELGRWFALAGGRTTYINNEDKYNEGWFRSILLEWFQPRHFLRIDSESLEDWQRKLSWACRTIRARMVKGSAAEKPLGMRMPCLFVVDSITNKASERTVAEIHGDPSKAVKGLRGETGTGQGSKRYPVDASVITDWMKASSCLFSDAPYMVGFVNHQKKGIDGENQTRTVAGGAHVKYQESFEIGMSRLGGRENQSYSDWEGYPVLFQTHKNAWAPTGRRIVTRVQWVFALDEATGEVRQRTIWNWDWSLVYLLQSMLSAGENSRSSPMMRELLKDHDIHVGIVGSLEGALKNRDGKAWSKNLDMKEKDAISWTELGAALHADSSFVAAFRKATGIKPVEPLIGDYRDALQRAREKADAA